MALCWSYMVLQHLLPSSAGTFTVASFDGAEGQPALVDDTPGYKAPLAMSHCIYHKFNC